MLRISKYIKSGILIVGLALFAGCSDSGDDNPTGGNNGPVLHAVWGGSEGIGHLFAQRCTPCHTSQHEGGFDVTTYNAMMANGDVIAGNANGSYLILKLVGDPNAGARMPQGGPFLATADIDTIKAWINAGALNN